MTSLSYDVPVTYIVTQAEKISEKQPVFKGKSGDSNALIGNLSCTIVFCKLCRVLYIIVIIKFTKKKIAKI